MSQSWHSETRRRAARGWWRRSAPKRRNLDEPRPRNSRGCCMCGGGWNEKSEGRREGERLDIHRPIDAPKNPCLRSHLLSRYSCGPPQRQCSAGGDKRRLGIRASVTSIRIFMIQDSFFSRPRHSQDQNRIPLEQHGPFRERTRDRRCRGPSPRSAPRVG